MIDEHNNKRMDLFTAEPESMPQHVLYAYHHGSDMKDIATELVARFERFVESREWKCTNVNIVNQRHPSDPSLREGDLPDWDLGLNFDLPNPGREPSGWVDDVEATAQFLGALCKDTSREFEFVIGAVNLTTGSSEDLFYVVNGEPDLELLKRVLGIEPH